MKKTLQTTIIFLLLLSSTFLLQAQTLLGELTGGEPEGEFGHAIALSSDGSIVAIGGYNPTFATGQVQVFQNDNGTWTQVGENIDGMPGEFLGYDVALSADGQRLALTALGGAAGNGMAAVYDNVDGTWTLVGDIIAGEVPGEQFGISVSLSDDGKRMAVAAVQGAGGAGSAKVFDEVDGAWVQVGNTFEGTNPGEFFGLPVVLSSDGTKLAIGAQAVNGAAGQAMMFEENEGTWTQVGQTLDGDAVAYQFGARIALSSDGTRMAVGGPGSPGDGTAMGHAKVYDFDGENWIQVGDDFVGAVQFEQVGFPIYLSTDGKTLVIGVHGHAGFTGRVDIYTESEGVWSKVDATLEGGAADQYGRGIAISDDASIIAVGSPGNDNFAGKVQVYGDISGTSVSTIQLEEAQLTLFPNPTSGLLNFNGPTIDRIEIMDNVGRILQVAPQPNSFIDISSLTTGIYNLRLEIEGQVYSTRIMKN